MQNKPSRLSAIERSIIAVTVLIVVTIAAQGVLRAKIDAEAKTLHTAAGEYVAFKRVQQREVGLANFTPGWTVEQPR